VAAAESVIDTHLHLLQPSRFHYSWLESASALDRDDEPNGVWETLCQHGITGGVLVEAANDETENAWLLEVARESPLDLCVIGWLNLAHRDTPEKIERLAAQLFFRGVRLNWFEGSHPTPAHKQALEVLSAHSLVLEILTEKWFLPGIAAWLVDYPDNPVVLNHMGTAGLFGAGFHDWQTGIRCFRDLSHVTLKLSGFASSTMGLAPVDEARRYLETALEIVGVERVICGSNLPMFEPTVTLSACYTHLRQTMEHLDAGTKSALLRENARRLYGF
jgi:L-fuconolactonase